MQEDKAEIMNRLREASEAYYNGGEPTMSDAEYDILVSSLTQQERDSLGADIVASAGDSKAHPKLVGSLTSLHYQSEVRDWYSGLRSPWVVVQPKIDGMSLVVEYRRGKLVSAASRGNGQVGEVVDVGMSVPRELVGENLPENLFVRGELVFLTQDWQGFADKDSYRNPRNAVAGISKSKRGIGDAPITFVAFEIFHSDITQAPKTQVEMLALLKAWGFNVVETELYNDLKEVFKYYQDIDRKALRFEADGLVLKLNDLRLCESMGYKGRYPMYAVAYKFPAKVVETKLISVSVGVGRTGRITPTAVLEAVEVGGVTVTNCALHNYQQIASMDLHYGDIILLKRSGDVIPYIEGVANAGERAADALPIKPPATCPACGGKVVAKGQLHFCENGYNCTGALFENLAHWVAKGRMDFDGFAGSAIYKLMQKGLLKEIADLYRLSKQDLLSLDGWGEKKARKALEQIEASKSKTWDVVLTSFGIPLIGSTMSARLFEAFDEIEDVFSASKSSLRDVIGNAATDSLLEWIGQNDGILEKLRSLGLKMSGKNARPKRQKLSEALAGLTFVITGTLSSPRKDFEALIVSNGGTLTGLNKTTSFLVVGENPGSKLDKAKKLGVKTITEEELKAML